LADIIKTGTEYDVELAKDDTPTLVKIGGTTEKFVPNINASKWDNECWLNINHPDVVNTETETFIDGKAEIEIGDTIHRYYVTPKGRLEYEIVLKTKPLSNKIELDLDFPDGLEFYYQDTLGHDYEQDSMGFTLEEYLSRAYRPDDVVGSYAVYWKKMNNQYKTGQFGMIYRPKAIDSSKKELWLNQTIAGKKWTIEIDQEWLDKAVYPVTIDPDLGYSTEGGSLFAAAANSWSASHDTTDASGGNTIQLHVWCDNPGVNDNFLICIYDDDAGNNRPEDQLLAEVEIEVLNGFDGQKDSNYVIAVAANTKYWIATVSEGGTYRLNYNASDANRHCYRNGAGYDLLANWTDAGANNTTRWSVWADYAAAGGGLSINVFDSISIAEALTPDQPLGPVSVNETLTITEFLSLLLQIAPNVFDTVTVAEFVQAVMSIKPEVFDTITITESVELLKDILPSVYDEITITEYINLALSGVGINVNDTITISEYVNLLFELKAVVNDTITVSEFISMFISSAGVNAFDLVSVQEYINLQFSDMEIAVDDTISIVENIVMSMSMSLNVYDAIAITENIVTTMDLGPVSVNEGISITEAITLAISPHYLSVSDTITISEWVQVMSSLISGLLSMTFTAKKPRIVFTAKKPSMTFTARKPRINFS